MRGNRHRRVIRRSAPSIGKIAISFVEWSGVGRQKIVIDWTIIQTRRRQRILRQVMRRRAPSRIDFHSGAHRFRPCRSSPARPSRPTATIDVSVTAPTIPIRDVCRCARQASGQGSAITVSSPERAPESWNRDHTNSRGGLEILPNNVIGGPGAFVMVAENFSSFGRRFSTS